MKQTLFISDLHLHPSRPEITTLFFRFLEQEATQAEALYILGDLFEYWLGDDACEHYSDIMPAIKQASEHTPVYFMVGNRDFLTGKEFARQSGCQMIDEPTQIDLYGKPTLLMHGDTLCTDDHEYLAFREMVRGREWRERSLAMDVETRKAYFTSLREDSKASAREKSNEIMDVNQDAVINTLKHSDVRRLIHGHTHRPDVHRYDIDGKPVERMVLGDWYKRGSVIRCFSDGNCVLEPYNG